MARVTANYSIPVAEYGDVKGPFGWNVTQGNAFDIIDSKMKDIEDSVPTGALDVSWASGYANAQAVLSDAVQFSLMHSGSSSYTPSSPNPTTTTYATVPGTSINFTAGGIATRAVYIITLPFASFASQIAIAHLYLNRNGTMIGTHRLIESATNYSGTATFVFNISPVVSGTYSIMARSYSTFIGIYMGQNNILNGSSGTFYMPIETIMYEV